MRVTRRTLLTAGALSAGVPLRANASPRLSRRHSFFGLHFDLHPNNHDKALGRDLTDEMVQHLIDQVKPDYVQYDCKGHVGYLGYPSKVSTPAPNIVHDSLEIWRRVTEKNGVALYIHFSGVWDSLAIREHPEWACVRPDGTPDPNATSTFGPYVDARMIPQLKEASEKYNLDGVWVDGECWAVRPDYSKASADAFREATGIRNLPRGPNEPGWQEFLSFQRERFRRYVKHYTDELHRARPKFQIASNWLYTTYVPEKPELPVDFISGDYLGNASISTARLEARYLSSVDKPWDLMAWGFQRATQSRVGLSHKPAVQLQQEASVVLAQGGGFQVYYQPTRTGWIDQHNIDVMANVAQFCRDRQSVSHGSASVPEIGVVFSGTSLYTTSNKLFGGWGSLADPARGMIDALVESHYSVDVIPEWRLEEMAPQYRLVVLPDWPNAGLSVKAALVKYVRNGGSLLITGAENASLFSTELPVKFSGEATQQPAFVGATEAFANVTGLWQNVDPGTADVVGHRYPTYDATRDGQCAATVSTLGSGKLAAVYGPLGAAFAATHAPGTRDFLRTVVERIHTPKLRVKAPATIEVALRRKGRNILVHLLNYAQMQVAGDYAVMDYVPPVGPVEIAIGLSHKPGRTVLYPGQRDVPGAWTNGVWTGTVDHVDIHSIIALEDTTLG